MIIPSMIIMKNILLDLNIQYTSLVHLKQTKNVILEITKMWRYIELLADEIELPGSCHDKPMRGKEARQYRLRHFHVEGDMIVVYCYNHMNDIYLVDLWHVASHDYLNKYYPNFK